MSYEVPVVSTSVGSELPLSEISSVCPDLDESGIRKILELQIREHHSLYRTEPFSIEYSRSLGGYLLRPRSVVGLVNCGDFHLRIGSKFQGIEIGKWLRLAHRCQAITLVNHNNNVTEAALSDQDALAGLDYFVMGLVSAAYDCVNNGLLYESGRWIGDDPNLNGRLSVAHHVKEGANPYRVQSIQSKKNFDVQPNRIVKTALKKCMEKCSNRKLRVMCGSLLTNFQEVAELLTQHSKISYEYVSSLTRPEYEKALALSKIVLEGLDSTQGETQSFLPFFTIDLDQLFEAYVAHELRGLMKRDSFEVKAQSEFAHPFSPELKRNFICPDLVVRSLEDDGRLVVLDTKNKYSLVNSSGAPKISNSDIFQMAYYAQALGSQVAVLVYPGDASNSTDYPIPSSEGKGVYRKKRDRALNRIFDSGSGFTISLGSSKISLISWRLNLAGTLQDTRKSVAQLCQFIAHTASGEILSD
jgi:hypothetical protein